MTELSKPTRELAARLLAKVSFEDRITGVEMSPSAGDMECFIFSFEEAASFLKVDEGSLSERSGWICHIDPSALKKWVGETLGDKELAKAIGETTTEYDNCREPIEQCLKKIELVRPIKELMEQRLKQCKELLGEKA